VNIGRRNKYPFPIRTHVARPQHNARVWWRPAYVVHARDAYQLAAFLFMHELYHWLVRRAKRNTRQKEGRCDRFAVRAMVDGFGAVVFDPHGRPAARDTWDFQDLDGFVARARAATPQRRQTVRVAARNPAPPRQSPVTPVSSPPRSLPPAPVLGPDRQLLLFPELGML
jgi:hypothetical protein